LQETNLVGALDKSTPGNSDASEEARRKVRGPSHFEADFRLRQQLSMPINPMRARASENQTRASPPRRATRERALFITLLATLQLRASP